MWLGSLLKKLFNRLNNLWTQAHKERWTMRVRYEVNGKVVDKAGWEAAGGLDAEKKLEEAARILDDLFRQ